MHPVQTRILKKGAAEPEARFSPSELAREFDVPLGTASYHVTALRKRGLLKKAGTKTVRGAVQHHYKLSENALEC
jgi:DNA-binding MarR family transcriptional regulator